MFLMYVLSENKKKNQKVSTENCYIYNHLDPLYIAWVCLRNHITIVLKPVFLYRGLGVFDKSSSKTYSPLRTVHRVSKIHSKLLSVILRFLSACRVSSVQLHLDCVPWQSSLCCALRAQTTSFYWCGAPNPGPGCQALKEGSLS